MSAESNNKDSQYSDYKIHRSRRSRSSRHSRLVIWSLGLALLFTIVIFFISIVYSSSRIVELTHRLSSAQGELYLKQQEVDELKSRLTHSNLTKFVSDKVLTVNKDFIKNIVFSVTTHGGSKIYEYRLVVENRSHETIKPKFGVLLFDKDGVEIAIDQILKGEELAPGESRSYSSKLDFFIKEQPEYFHVTNTILTGAERMQEVQK